MTIIVYDGSLIFTNSVFQSTQNISFKGKTTKEILNEIIWQFSVKMGYTNKL